MAVGLPCSYASDASTASVTLRLPDDDGSGSRSPDAVALSAQVDAQKYLEAFFEQNDSAARLFMHKASVMADFHQNRLDPLVLQALCARGRCHLLPSTDAGAVQAEKMMKQVECSILTGMGEITLSRLQALTLLLHYRIMTAKRNELWMLLSLAARMAFTLCLNHEHHDLSPVRQECNRRLMWSIYMLDTLLLDVLESTSLRFVLSPICIFGFPVTNSLSHSGTLHPPRT